MAVASIRMKYLDDITECPICTEVYTDPRMLPCIHTFCLKCISTWGKDKEPGDSLACPLCRKEVKLPAGGLKELQRNIFVEKLLDAKRLSSLHSSGDELCEVCDNATKMSMHCVDCQQSMCQGCSAGHKRLRITKSHKLVEISSQSEGVIGMLKMSESFCDKHEDERLKLYCFDCKLVVCMMCFVHCHQSHKCRDVKEVADELSGKMKADVKKLTGKVTECQNMLKQLTVAFKECIENADKTEREIIARANFMKQQVDEIKDSLIQEVRSNKKVQDKKFETLRDELERHAMMMESFHKYSDELIEKGTACDIARAASDMQDRARELMQVNVSERELVNVQSCQSKYTLVFSDPIKRLGDLFGQLDQRVAAITQAFATAAGGFPTSIKPLHVIQSTGSQVGGVTSLNDEVFVVRWNSCQQVDVYDVDTMSLKRSLHVPDLGTMVICGLVACSVNNCLYVSDYNLNIVHRVTLSTINTIVTKWSVGNTPEGLSLNSSHNLLVACCGKNKFQEYTTHGSLVREIKLRSSTENMAHVVQLSVSEFGVTYCKPKSCYSVVGVDGRFIRSYSNSGAGELKNPHCIAVNKRGFVFIADHGNNRIVVLHPQTLCSRVLPVDGGLDGPIGLWLDESRDRLYIGEFNGKRVIVITGVNDICL